VILTHCRHLEPPEYPYSCKGAWYPDVGVRATRPRLCRYRSQFLLFSAKRCRLLWWRILYSVEPSIGSAFVTVTSIVCFLLSLSLSGIEQAFNKLTGN